jgi:hypothetical protein
MGGGYFFSPIISTFVGDPFRSRPTQDFRGVNAGRFSFAKPSFPEVRGPTSARLLTFICTPKYQFCPFRSSRKVQYPHAGRAPEPERKSSSIKEAQDHGWLILAREVEGKLVGSADIFVIKSTIEWIEC